MQDAAPKAHKQTLTSAHPNGPMSVLPKKSATGSHSQNRELSWAFLGLLHTTICSKQFMLITPLHLSDRYYVFFFDRSLQESYIYIYINIYIYIYQSKPTTLPPTRGSSLGFNARYDSFLLFSCFLFTSLSAL